MPYCTDQVGAAREEYAAAGLGGLGHRRAAGLGLVRQHLQPDHADEGARRAAGDVLRLPCGEVLPAAGGYLDREGCRSDTCLSVLLCLPCAAWYAVCAARPLCPNVANALCLCPLSVSLCLCPLSLSFCVSTAGYNKSLDRDSVIIEGWLNKKNQRGVEWWKKRYFVLKGHTLAYYLDETEAST